MSDVVSIPLDRSGAVPDHVAPELVRDYPLLSGLIVEDNPYETMVPDVHAGPSVFYAKGILLGGRNGWVVRRAADLRSIYSDTENFHKRGNTNFSGMVGETWDMIPTELDPPRHTAFRSVLNPIFSPARMAALNDKVRLRARTLIDAFKARGGCDLVNEFAVPFPVSIFLDLIGLPQSDMPQFLAWERALIRGTPAERSDSVVAVRRLLLDAIDERRKRPTGDLISNALTLEVEGRPWTDDEILGHCMNLYVGGLDTVSSNMSLHFRHLALNPDQQADLRAEPKRVVLAIEELLRAYPAVTTQRIVSKPYTIAGATFMPGDFVAMPTPLAGRDPEEYDDPHAVRFDRKPTHLTLGYGPHRCLGQHLARREMQIAVEEFLAAIPAFTLAPGTRAPFYLGSIIQVETLELAW